MPTIDKERWLRVSALLDDLLDAPAAARQARLAALEPQDPALASQVRLLLAAADWVERTRFLEGSALRHMSGRERERWRR